MNYSLDHSLLKTDLYLTTLKGSVQKTSWMVLCAIIHFTKYTGGMDFYAGQYANDIGVKDATMKIALDGLVKNKCITVVREYQRKGNIPRRYLCNARYIPKAYSSEKGYTPIVGKVYADSQKGIAPRDKVKEFFKKNSKLKSNDDDFSKSSLDFIIMEGWNDPNFLPKTDIETKFKF